MRPSCRRCGAPLGPQEGEACLHHGPRRATVMPAIVRALETSPVPLGIDAVCERLAREGVEATRGRVATEMAADRSLCWARKGTYGLVRHGLVPGVRSLEDLVLLAVVAAGGSAPIYDVCRAIEARGYGKSTSVEAAIAKADPTRLTHDRLTVSVPDLAAARAAVDSMIMRGTHWDGLRSVFALLEIEFTDPAPWPIEGLLEEWRALLASPRR